MIALISCIGFTECQTLEPIAYVNHANRKLIGQEGQGIAILKGQENANQATLLRNPSSKEPTLLNAMADSTRTFPYFIKEIPLKDGLIPEIIMQNGALAILTQQNSLAWDCQSGDIVYISVETYPSEVIEKQILEISYLKNGMLHSSGFVRERKGTYQINIEEDGLYYFCLGNMSSDPLTLKTGSIERIDRS